MNAQTTLTAIPAARVYWCPSCGEVTEAYQMTREDMADRGALYSITDALTGVQMFSLHGRLIATDTDLCGGCDRVLG